jgi:hypothetical protein
MIRLTDLRYGPGYIQTPGAVVTLTPDEEQALLAAKRAERIETAAKPIPQHNQPMRGKRHVNARPTV